MRNLPLAPPAALLTDAAGDRQAATVEKFGQVSIVEISLARQIAASESTVEAVKQHARRFDFYLVPIKFGVIGFDGKTCKWLQLGATLKAPGAGAEQVFLLDVFPSSSLKKGALTTDAKLTVSSDLKLAVPDGLPAGGNLNVGGAASMAWTWSPLYQQVAAVFDQSRVIWRFDAVGDEFPVGQTEVGAIIAVARPVSTSQRRKIGFDVELRASFGGGWFDSVGIARAATTILVQLP